MLAEEDRGRGEAAEAMLRPSSAAASGASCRRGALRVAARAAGATILVSCFLCTAPRVHGLLLRDRESSRPSSAEDLVLANAAQPRPQYARVEGSIETLWQRPTVEPPRGIFFMAHGCHHQAPDFFNEVAADGWRFEACKESYFGRCLGLPEEVKIRDAALSRGYVAVAVSGGAGKESCWAGADVEKVQKAIAYVVHLEKLPEDAPVLAFGASSGGALLGALASPGGVPNLKCIVPQISSVASLTHSGGVGRKIPTLFVHMPRDQWTADGVEDDALLLKASGVRVASLEVEPTPVTEELFRPCLGPELANKVADAIKVSGLLDERGFLRDDSRAREWVSVVKPVIEGKSDDSLLADQSCISERLNVAWAFHEMSAQYAEEMLDFCEGRGRYAAGAGEDAAR